MDGWQRAFVLHTRPYSETRLLLDFFTETEGRIRLLAKSARSSRSNLKGCLQPFTPLLIRWEGNGRNKNVACRRTYFSSATIYRYCIAVYMLMNSFREF